jgi:hypothetical protein
MSNINTDQLRPVGADGVHVFDEAEWGYPQTLYVGKPEDLTSTTPGIFTAVVRLQPTNSSARPIDVADASPENLLDGDSNYSVPPEVRTTHLKSAGGDFEISVTVHENEHGRAAALTWSPFQANGLAAAIRLVNEMLQRLALLYPATTGVPLLWDTVVVESADEPISRAVTVHAGYPVVNLPNGFEFGGRSLGIMDYLGPHLVEGLRSQSPFWRVICYYKVSRFYYTGLRKKFERLRYLNDLPNTEHRVLPASAPFDVIAADLAGKRYTEIVDKLRAEYRNTFAHFSTDEAMTPLNAQDEERAARASAVLKRIALDAVTDARADIAALSAAGVTLEEINQQIAAVDTAEKASR